MATTAAVLLTSPETDEGTRFCDVRLAPRGHRARGRIVERPGDWFPYRAGDRVRVQLVEDDPAAGVHITGLWSPPAAQGDGNAREIHGRGGGIRLVTHGGTVRVSEAGDADGGQQRVALIDDLRKDVLSLQQQIDGLVANLNTALTPSGPLAPGGPTVGGLWTVAQQAYAVPLPWAPAGASASHAGATGGKAAARLYATPEEGP